MPIEFEVDSLDTIPEALRGEYKQVDGKFQLDLNGHPDAPVNLKSALTKERDARQAFKALNKTPEEIAALLAREGDTAAKSSEHRIPYQASVRSFCARNSFAQS